MADPKYTPALIGRVLAEGDLDGDSEVARRYEINRATVGTWRHRVADDGAIAEAYHEARAELASKWADDAARTLTTVWAEIRRRVVEDPDNVKFTDLLGSARAITEALIQHNAMAGGGASGPLPQLGRPPKKE